MWMRQKGRAGLVRQSLLYGKRYYFSAKLQNIRGIYNSKSKYSKITGEVCSVGNCEVE